VKCVQVTAVLSIGNSWLTRRGQTSLPTSASVDAGTHTGNIEGIYHLRHPITAASIQAQPCDAHLGSGVKPPMPIQAPLFCRARPYAASGAISLDVSWKPDTPGLSFRGSSVFGPPGGVPAPETNPNHRDVTLGSFSDMAFARLFPIDAVNAQDDDRTSSELSLSDGTCCGRPAPTK
jgi:hypothetical protein